MLLIWFYLIFLTLKRYDQATRGLQVIERSGAVLKLAQGEWVIPTKIENILELHPHVHQSFVFGSSLASFLVVVVVPSANAGNISESQLVQELRYANF